MLRNPKSLVILGFLLATCSIVCAQGLKGEYFPNMTLNGQPALTRIEAVNFSWGGASPGGPVAADGFSVRWTGSITVPVTGDYVFSTQTDDGVRLWVGPDLIINNWSDHSSTLNTSTPIRLRAGEPVGIKLEYYENGGDAIVQFFWSGPGITQQAVPESVLSPTYKACNPKPADGTVGVSAPLLEWSAGPTAMFHNVYVGTDPNLTEADRWATWQPLPLALYYHVPGFTPGATYYWRVDEIEKDGITTHTGDVWSFVAQGLTAYYPTPVDTGSSPSTEPALTWMPGLGATQHHVYFGTDADAVAQGAGMTDQGLFALADTVFEPGTLDPLTTYYWRVDQVATGGAIMAGPVWSFTTALPIDGFEEYNDDDNRIYDAWIDGVVNNTGSYVGYESSSEGTFGETTIVHGGSQSMPLDYNNVDVPYYSEAEREFASVQDWTVGGGTTLVLYVRGVYTNGPAQVYVMVEDSSGKMATVPYSDPAITTWSEWAEWKIPFAELSGAGVNMARVKKLYLGAGNKANPEPGSAGLIYVDDICVVK